MTAILHKLSPQQVRDRIDNGGAVLIDIRETDEFARSHVRGAQSHPLSTWEKAHLNIEPKADVIFTCRSGMRTAGACDRLAAAGVTRISAIGSMSMPEAGWHHDGRFNLLDLVRMTEIEQSAEAAAQPFAPYAD